MTLFIFSPWGFLPVPERQERGAATAPVPAMPVPLLPNRPLPDRNLSPEGRGNHGFFVQERGAHHHV